MDIENEEITLYRKEGPPWIFKYESDGGIERGYYHYTSKNTYRLFFQNPADHGKPFWIGKLAGDSNYWYTIEGVIGADYIEFCGSRIVFE